MIEIDGSFGEGGGALLRQALGLAAYQGVGLRVRGVRARRDPPGLKPQHLTAVKAVAAISGGEALGLAPGSTEVTFLPGRVTGGAYEFDIGTAGSTTLLLQALLVPCLCRGEEFVLDVVGGTDVTWSPPADYLARVTMPALAGFGAADLALRRRGYYPKGGGRLSVRLAGGEDPGPLELTRPAPAEGIAGISHASSFLRDRRVAERQAEAAHAALRPLDLPVEIAAEYADTANPGSGITLWTKTSGGSSRGGSALGSRGKPAEEVGREAAESLRRELEADAAIDRHLADQLIPFLAIVGGSVVTSEITEHTRSNIYVAETIVGARFDLDGRTIRARRADRPGIDSRT